MEYVDRENIFDYLIQSEKSISELAKETGVSRSTLYNILTGRTNPSYLTLHILAEALELSETDFISSFFSTIEFKKEVVSA